MKRRNYKEKNKGGRPAFSEELKRKPRAMVRMNEGEYDIVSNKAKEAGLSLSEYLREIAIKGKVITPDKTKAQLLTELMKQGRNLNQITKRINQGHPMDEKDKNRLEGLKMALKNIYEILMKSLMKG